MSQKIDYHARTEPQIPLMSDKLTNLVGNTVFPFSDKGKQREFFDQMFQDLLCLTSTKKHYLVASCALETIKVLLVEIECLTFDIQILSYQIAEVSHQLSEVSDQ